MRAANLLVRFFLELCALAALSVWGFQGGTGAMSRLGLAVAAPALFALLWGALVAPKARFRVPPSVWWLLGVILLELAALALVGIGRRELSLVFAVAIAVNAGLLLVWGE